MKTETRNKKKHLLILIGIVCLFGMVYAQDSKTKVTPQPAVKPKPSIGKAPMIKSTFTTTDNQYNTKKDINGNVYKTGKIGNQIWMTENLKATKYNDGTPIPMVTDNYKWSVLQIGVFSFFNNNQYDSECGNLYNWYVVNTGKLAPQGWHIPTDDDWFVLFTYLGGADVAGKKMKSKKGWAENGNGTNESGFSGSPCNGYRLEYNGDFIPNKLSGTYWHSTSSIHYELFYSRDDIISRESSRSNGYTIPYVKN